jgi:hypothetical protein
VRVRAVGLACAGVLSISLIAACGDGGEEALTKAEFIAEGNTICGRALQAIRDGAQSSFTQRGQVPSPEQIEGVIENSLVPEVDRQLEELADLEPPEQDSNRVGDILSEGQDGLEKVRATPMLVMSDERDPLKRYQELAGDYGLEACSQSSPTMRNEISNASKGT